VSLVGAFFAEGDVRMELVDQMHRLTGPEGAALTQTVIDHTMSQKASLWSLLVGTSLTLFGATTVFAQLQHALNRVWRVAAAPGNAIVSFIRQRLLSFAIVLDRGQVYARGVFRLGFFLPYAVPSVIATIIWGYLYGPNFGPFTQMAKAFNLPPPDFLSPGAMIFSLANIVTWEYVGYNMVIYYAALKAIPSDLAEASRMDGASPWQFARLIQLPLLWPAILLTIIFSINGTLQLFNEPYLMRALARNTINSSYTPNLYAYSLATSNQQYGYAAAVSFVLGIVIAGASYIFTLITNRRRPAQ